MLCVGCGQVPTLQHDFEFVELALEFLETGDEGILEQIADLDGAVHIFNHAQRYNSDLEASSPLELVKYLLTPRGKHLSKLSYVYRNLKFAKKHLAEAEKLALQLLPKGFVFSGKIFLTFGYDIGVVFGENCSLNLAHPIFAENEDDLIQWAVHEMHHAGFVTLKGGYMPAFDIVTRGEMADLIAYLTHLEGTATFAQFNGNPPPLPLDAWDEYFEIYDYFHKNPNLSLTDKDWDKINILSDEKRLWYTVGAEIASLMDKRGGRHAIAYSIKRPSKNFISAVR